MKNKFQNLTVDFSQLQSIPVQERVSLAKSQVGSDIFGNMTPTEIAKLFPTYYQKTVPAIQGFTKALSGSTSVSGNTGGSSTPGSKTNSSVAPVEPVPQTIAQYINDAVNKKTPISGNFSSQAPAVMKRLMADFNLTKDQAAGIVGNLGHESMGMQAGIQELKPVAGRGGLGWAQWTGPRRRAFESYLQQNGLEATDPEANYGFLKQELMSTHAHALEAIRKAKDAREATILFEQTFEVAGVKHYDSRLKYTDQAISAFDQAETTENEHQTETTDAGMVSPVGDGADQPTTTGQAQPEFVITPDNIASIADLDPKLRDYAANVPEAEREQFYNNLNKLGGVEKINKIMSKYTPPALATATPTEDGKLVQAGAPTKVKPVQATAESLAEFYSQRNPRTPINEIMQVDPTLLKSYAEAIQQYEIANPNYKVEMFGDSSATRTSGSTANHGIQADGYGKALDFVIIDRATGKQISNLGQNGYPGQTGGSELASQQYTRLHALARIAQEHFAPDEVSLRQGGGFRQGVTADWMHGDIKREAMAGYSWETGYTPDFKNEFNIKENLVLGDEKRIKELGQQIYGEVDEEGYYKNNAAYAETADGNVTVVPQKVETQVAENPHIKRDDSGNVITDAGMVPLTPETQTTGPVPEPAPDLAPPQPPAPEEAPAQAVPLEAEPVQPEQEVSTEAPVPVDQSPAPAQVAEQTATATPAPPETPPTEEPKKMAGGGYIDNKDNLSVVNQDTGDVEAMINKGEVQDGIKSEGTGVRVEPNGTRKADALLAKYDATPQTETVATPQPQQEQNQQPQQPMQAAMTSPVDQSKAAHFIGGIPYASPENYLHPSLRRAYGNPRDTMTYGNTQ